MTTNHAPRLAYNDWQVIDPTTLMVWIDDIQFFDISSPGNSVELRINNVVDGTALYLGDSETVGRAIVRARKYLKAGEKK